MTVDLDTIEELIESGVPISQIRDYLDWLENND